MLLTVVALATGIAVSVPLAVLATRVRALQGPLLGLAGIVQTVPSLALLALMVLALGKIGFVPAIIALILYSMLPILRNTVTGITGVDPALIEASRGLGMTDAQMLRKVQLPLAAPVIIAGIRTSTVWVVGIATLSTPVGQRSLGNYIFAGLQTQNHTAVAIGCIAAAALAIVLDLLIRLMETASARRSRGLGAVAGLGLCAVVAGGLAPLIRPTAADTIVGAKTFTEQFILADVLATRLRDEGFRVEKKQSMGSTILFESLANGSVDAYVDYSGTIWVNVMKRADTPEPQVVLAEMSEYLEEKHGIVCLGPLGFENTYALAVRRETAERLGIRTIEDLARHAPDMRIGGDYEFFGRPEWTTLRDKYNLRFQRTVSLDSTLMYPAIQNGEVEVISAFSSDGRILAYDLVVLEDTRRAFPPYDAVLLLSARAAERPGLADALQPLVGAITNDMMRLANKRVDLDKQTPATAAEALLDAAMANSE
jgi:osmoprotectant transport system permease protein